MVYKGYDMVDQTNDKRDNKIQKTSITGHNVIGDVSLCFICKSICRHLIRSEIICSFIIAIIIALFQTLLSLKYNAICLECVREFYNSLLPSLLGFSITIYAVLFSISGNINKRLIQKARNKKRPFLVLHATFVFGIIIQGITLLLGMFTNIATMILSKEIVGGICWFIMTFIIIWSINTVFHLYALRTFIIEYK